MKEYSVNILNLSEKDSFQDASKEELRVLLAIISAGGRFEDSDHLARLAKTSRARAAASLAFWEDAKVITEGKAEMLDEVTVKAEYENDEIPEQSAKEVAKEIKDKGLASLLSECALLMGKPMLSSAETKKIVNVYSQYALNEEYIITLAAFLNEQNKLTAVRLANDAERLAKKGIDCVEELEIYIAKKARTTDSDWQYKHFFAIFDRPLSDDESERAERWFSTYGYSEEIVGLAYSITTKNKGKLEIAYMDSIIAGWFNAGCKTADDCRAENERFKEGWKAENSKDDSPTQTKRRSTKEKPRYGEFNVEDAFAKALERSYGASDDEE